MFVRQINFPQLLALAAHRQSLFPFSRGDREMFAPLVRDLREHDPFLVCANFRASSDCQRRVAELWQTPEKWIASSIINVGHAGKIFQ